VNPRWRRLTITLFKEEMFQPILMVNRVMDLDEAMTAPTTRHLA
jgi:acyl-CoA reductase-like NAD-dependent aldehyde dehydrogenase